MMNSNLLYRQEIIAGSAFLLAVIEIGHLPDGSRFCG